MPVAGSRWWCAVKPLGDSAMDTKLQHAFDLRNFNALPLSCAFAVEQRDQQRRRRINAATSIAIGDMGLNRGPVRVSG